MLRNASQQPRLAVGVRYCRSLLPDRRLLRVSLRVPAGWSPSSGEVQHLGRLALAGTSFRCHWLPPCNYCCPQVEEGGRAVWPGCCLCRRRAGNDAVGSVTVPLEAPSALTTYESLWPSRRITRGCSVLLPVGYTGEGEVSAMFSGVCVLALKTFPDFGWRRVILPNLGKKDLYKKNGWEMGCAWLPSAVEAVDGSPGSALC